MSILNGQDIVLGDWDTVASDNRKTIIEYEGRRYVIVENYWESVEQWQVTASLFDHHDETEMLLEEDLVTMLNIASNIAKILSALGYKFDKMIDETVTIWVKSKHSSS